MSNPYMPTELLRHSTLSHKQSIVDDAMCSI